jgi:hypothetical protein
MIARGIVSGTIERVAVRLTTAGTAIAATPASQRAPAPHTDTLWISALRSAVAPSIALPPTTSRPTQASRSTHGISRSIVSVFTTFDSLARLPQNDSSDLHLE